MNLRPAIYFLALLLSTSFAACKKDGPATNTRPNINYKYVSMQLIEEGISPNLVIAFDLYDEEGDLADAIVTVTDKRDTTIFPLRLPADIATIPPPVNGQTYVTLGSNFLTVKNTDTSIKLDTVLFDLYVTDNSGNQSNTITTDTIIITRK